MLLHFVPVAIGVFSHLLRSLRLNWPAAPDAPDAFPVHAASLAAAVPEVIAEVFAGVVVMEDAGEIFSLVLSQLERFRQCHTV